MTGVCRSGNGRGPSLVEGKQSSMGSAGQPERNSVALISGAKQEEGKRTREGFPFLKEKGRT